MVGGKTSQKPSQWQKKAQLTHFLCLPLVNEASFPQLQQSLKQFSEDIGSDPANDSTERDEDGATDSSLRMIHPKAIRPLGTLHLTLGVMSLTADRLSEASDLLRKLDVKVLLNESNSQQLSGPDPTLKQKAGASPFTISLTGLESMHPPTSTSILYAAPIDPTARLYDFCLEVRRRFQDFLVADDRPLKLHATIVNTLYAKGKKSASRSQGHGHGPNAKSSMKFDARDVLERYVDYVWAEGLRLEKIAICEMGAEKVLDEAKVRVVEERYVEVASVALSGTT